MRRFLAVILVLSVAVFSFYQFYFFLKKRIVTSDFKLITENRIGELIGAHVHVDRISLGLLDHVSISGLEIEQTKNMLPFLLGAKKLEIQYDFQNFMKRDFRIPKNIFLESPRLTLSSIASPGSLFNAAAMKSDRGFITQLEVEGGQIDIPWFNQKEKLSLVNMEGQMKPGADNVFKLHFHSDLKGIAEGDVIADGRADADQKNIELSMDLRNINFLESSSIPVKRLNGVIHFSNDKVKIEKLEFLLRDIPLTVSGEIDHIFSKKPVISIDFNFNDKKIPVRFGLKADLNQESLSGQANMLHWSSQFQGSLKQSAHARFVSDFMINDRYEAHGDFNFENMVFDFDVKRNMQQYHVSFSMEKFSGELRLLLNHLDLFGFDTVTASYFRFSPNEIAWEKNDHVFDVALKTDYLVFQYQPLRDFEATAQLSIRGFENLVARWGSVSEIRGGIFFKPEPVAKMTLRVAQISLKEFKSFGTHPLPRSLEGILEGKLDITGPLSKPMLNGAFMVSNGAVGKLRYDGAIINFSGHLPYLALQNSKVWIGKSTFLLEGGIDFELRNFLQSAEIINSEHAIIWKGLELTPELEEMLLEEIGKNNTSSESKGPRMDAEYKFDDRTSVRVEAGQDQNKSKYVTVGPKLKF